MVEAISQNKPAVFSVRPQEGRLRLAYTIQNAGLDLARPVGDAIPVLHTLRGLRRRGHAVRLWRLRGRQVIAYDDPGDLKNPRLAPLGPAGARPYLWLESAIRRLQGALGLPYFALFDTHRFYQAMLRVLPGLDLCHEHNALFSTATAAACGKLGLPYVLTFSGDVIFELDLAGRPLQGVHLQVARRQAAFTYRQADAILCVSSPAREHLSAAWQVPAEKIHVLPNGVDLALFDARGDAHATRRALGWPDNPIIGFVSGFQPWHGFEILLEAFARLQPDCPPARLLLVGDGPHRPRVQAEITRWGLSHAVHLTGWVPPEQVRDYLQVMDIAVLPFPRLPRELWFSPLKLYEYMAAGKAIVASRDGQIAEVISDRQNGLLVEPGAADAFARAFAELLGDPGLRRRLGTSAREKAVRDHSWERYLDRLEQVYQQVLSST